MTLQNNKIQCGICDKVMFKYQKQAHLFNVHKIKPQCKICHKKLDPRSLKRHMKSQHQSEKLNKPIDCLICG